MVRHTYARSFMQSGSCVGENPAAKRLRGEKKTHKVWKSPRAVYQTYIVSTESSTALTCEFTPQAQNTARPRFPERARRTMQTSKSRKPANPQAS